MSATEYEFHGVLKQLRRESELTESLRAEVVRLRAALKQIALMADEDSEWDGADRFRRVRDFARRALEQKDTEQ